MSANAGDAGVVGLPECQQHKIQRLRASKTGLRTSDSNVIMLEHF